MSRASRIASIPFVAGMIYAWLLKQAARDAVGAVGRRFWPGPPIDHP
jgi:hypothetical protein